MTARPKIAARLAPAEAASHRRLMARALTAAARAARRGEVPIGAVLVRNGEVISSGHNLTRTRRDPTAHAEMVVILEAIKTIGNERFVDTMLYVTLEPCAMCAGAIVQARIPVVVYGADDPKAGACGSVLKVIPNRNLNHRPVVIKGVMADESAQLLRGFFQARRGRKKAVL